MHACVRAHLARLRSGSAHTKTRWEVRGSSRKLRPQKRTGKARVGDASSPTRRGGGVIHGPRRKDWGYSVPRKVDELGLRTALSVKWREGSLSVIDRLDWASLSASEEAVKSSAVESGSELFEEGLKDESRELFEGGDKDKSREPFEGGDKDKSRELFEGGDKDKSRALFEDSEATTNEGLSEEREERELLSAAGLEPTDGSTRESGGESDRPSKQRPSTRLLSQKLAAQEWSNALFILGREPSPEFVLSARNLPDFEHRLVRDTDIYTLLKRRRVILDLEAVGQLEDWLDAGMTPQSVRETGFEEQEDEEILLSEEEAEAVEAEAQTLVGEAATPVD
jgi:ribosomal protein L4